MRPITFFHANNFTPPPAGPTPIAWYKADQITGLSDGDPLSTWLDQSGNGYDIAASGSARPLYKTGIINSLPSVRFDGSNDILATSSNVIFSTGCTVFAVTKNRIRKDYNGIITISPSTTSDGYADVYWQDNVSNSGNSVFLLNRVASITYVVCYNTGPAVNSYYIGCWNNTGSALAQYINGTLLSADASSGSDFSITNSKLFVGALCFSSGPSVLDGDIAELHIYSPALTTNERNAVFATLNSKYAIY